MTSDSKDGSTKAMIPHTAPKRKEDVVRCAIENERPVPTIVRPIDAVKIVLADGKATRLIKL